MYRVMEWQDSPDANEARDPDRFTIPYSMPETCIGKFVGRDMQLGQIEQYVQPALAEKRRRKDYVFQGLNGIGKTQLAVE